MKSLENNNNKKKILILGAALLLLLSATLITASVITNGKNNSSEIVATEKYKVNNNGYDLTNYNSHDASDLGEITDDFVDGVNFDEESNSVIDEETWMTSVESRAVPKPTFSGTHTVYASSRSKAFNQGAYRIHIPGTGKTIAGSGCGWCSLSAACANLSPKCKDMTPADWASIVPSSVGNYWAGSSGMSWSAPRAWVDWLNKDGSYGKFKLVESQTGVPESTVINTIEKYAGDPDTVVLVSASAGWFTNGGHIMCVSNYDASDDTFTLLNSSSKPVYLGLCDNWASAQKYKWPCEAKSFKGYSYNFKCAWVIKYLGE